MKIYTPAGLLLENKKKPTSKSVLMNWLNEVASFHQNYQHIEKYVGQQIKKLCPSGLEVTQHNSQCSLSSLVTLQTAMRAELERLIIDMEQDGQDLVKLKAHTLQLSRLNQQAQARLMLSRNPAS